MIYELYQRLLYKRKGFNVKTECYSQDSLSTVSRSTILQSESLYLSKKPSFSEFKETIQVKLLQSKILEGASIEPTKKSRKREKTLTKGNNEIFENGVIENTGIKFNNKNKWENKEKNVEIYESKCLAENFERIKNLIDNIKNKKVEIRKKNKFEQKSKIKKLFEKYYLKEEQEKLNSEMNQLLKNLTGFHSLLLALNKFCEIKEQDLLISSENLSKLLQIFIQNALIDWVSMFIKEMYLQKIQIPKELLDQALAFLVYIKEKSITTPPTYKILENPCFAFWNYSPVYWNFDMFKRNEVNPKKRLNPNSIEFSCTV